MGQVERPYFDSLARHVVCTNWNGESNPSGEDYANTIMYLCVCVYFGTVLLIRLGRYQSEAEGNDERSDRRVDQVDQRLARANRTKGRNGRSSGSGVHAADRNNYAVRSATHGAAERSEAALFGRTVR